jgi:hypothetical protein
MYYLEEYKRRTEEHDPGGLSSLVSPLIANVDGDDEPVDGGIVFIRRINRTAAAHICLVCRLIRWNELLD